MVEKDPSLKTEADEMIEFHAVFERFDFSATPQKHTHKNRSKKTKYIFTKFQNEHRLANQDNKMSFERVLQLAKAFQTYEQDYAQYLFLLIISTSSMVVFATILLNIVNSDQLPNPSLLSGIPIGFLFISVLATGYYLRASQTSAKALEQQEHSFLYQFCEHARSKLGISIASTEIDSHLLAWQLVDYYYFLKIKINTL